MPDGNHCKDVECDNCQDEIRGQHESYHEDDRSAIVRAFFTAFDNVNSDPSWLAEREQEIGVTPDEWEAYRAEKAARTFDVSEVF
jgi:hypothetical protein